MQAPICEVCLNSDMLCSACKDKLESNKINQAEIDVSRFLYELKEKVRSLHEVKIEKVIETNSLLIISGKGDAPKLVGKGGSVVKALAKKFGKSVKIVENADSYREFMQNLLGSTVIRGINTLFTANGEKYKIRIASSHKANLSLKEEEIASISQLLFNKPTEIVFEN